MTVPETLDRLDAIIDESAYVKHSFVSSLVSGEISREKLRAWAIQKFHQTYQQNRGFSAVHANSPYEDVRQYEMGQLIAEETGLADGTDSHYNLMRRFAMALGADDDLDGVGPSREVEDFVDYLVDVCKSRHFVYGLLAFYINERQTPAAVERMRTYLLSDMGLSESDVEWFTVHGDVDGEHAARARRLIEKYAGEVPDFDSEAEKVVRNGCDQWLRLQDHYYSIATS
jgi:pyrroloquinoline-quinone synthase